MIARRSFLLRVAGVFAACLAPRANAATKHRTETKPAPPAQPPEKPKTARLRLWKATDAPQQPLQVRIFPFGNADPAAGTSLNIETQEYQFNEYATVPAGAVAAGVTVQGMPPAQIPLSLAPDGQSTLLVRFQGGQLSVEWIDDTPKATDAGCEFTAYNLLPTSGAIQITLGTVLNAQLANNRSSLRLSGLKPAAYPIAASGTGMAGREIRWNSDVDFNRYRKAKLLIFPDPYGRVRPRIETA